MNTDLTLEHLKTMRLALNHYPLNSQVLDTIDAMDKELAKHNLKCVRKILPKEKYQRKVEGVYVFEPINEQ